MNSVEPKNRRSELRSFGLTLGSLTALVFGLVLPWLFERQYPAWPWVVAGVLISVALIAPLVLRPVFSAWITIGHWLGWINTRIILGLMFFTVFFLVGLVLKFMGKDPMARKFDETATSYRVPSQARRKDHMERPF
jgi:hypothetical protein